MSEEEIDRLEKEEIEEEEEMEKRKHRDLLQDLENRFEEVKYIFKICWNYMELRSLHKYYFVPL